MTRRSKLVIVNLLAVILLLGIAEIISRVLIKKIYNREFDSSLIEEHRYFSSDGLKADATGWVWGKSFHTDRYGGRKQKQLVDRKKKTWLFIGDSVTEGVGVDDSLTFSSFAAEALDSVNILNISMIGWSMPDYLNAVNFFLTRADSLNIERVCIFYCLNDIYGSSSVKELPAIGNKGMISTANAFLQDRYMTYKLLKLLWTKNSNRYYQYDSDLYDDHKKYYADMLSCADAIRACCERRNVQERVYVLPYRYQVVALKNPSSDSENAVNKKLKKLNTGNETIAEWIYKKNSKEDFNSLYLFSDEIHFSSKGHRLIAEYILSHLN